MGLPANRTVTCFCQERKPLLKYVLTLQVSAFLASSLTIAIGTLVVSVGAYLHADLGFSCMGLSVLLACGELKPLQSVYKCGVCKR